MTYIEHMAVYYFIILHHIIILFMTMINVYISENIWMTIATNKLLYVKLKNLVFFNQSSNWIFSLTLSS